MGKGVGEVCFWEFGGFGGYVDMMLTQPGRSGFCCVALDLWLRMHLRPHGVGGTVMLTS